MASSYIRSSVSIVVVLILAAALRLQDVNQPYVDAYAWREASTASTADAFAKGNWNIFMPQVGWGGPGPNYVGAEFQTVSYLAAIGYQFFGSQPWVGRAVSIAFGLWGIFALYQLVRRVWDEPRAVAAAAVMAVLPGSVLIERSFLPDGAMTALMTTSLWMLVAWCQTDKASYLVLATLTGALGCLTKLPGGILLIPAVYILISLCEPKLRKSQFRIRVIAAATTVVGLVGAYYLWARHVALTYPPFHFKGEGKFLWNDGVSVWLAEDWFIPDLWGLLVGSGGLWGYPFFILASIGLIVPFPMALKSKHGIWLFHFFLLALLVRFFLEAEHLAKDPYNLHLYNIAAAAFGGHALAAGATVIARVANAKAAVAVVVAVLAILTLYGQLGIRKFFASSYADHYALGRQIKSISVPSDLVISFGAEPLVLYHAGRLGWVFPPADAWSQSGAWDYGLKDLALLDSLISQKAAYIAIPSWNSYTGGAGQELLQSAYPILYAGLRSRFELISNDVHGMIYRVAALPRNPLSQGRD